MVYRIKSGKDLDGFIESLQHLIVDGEKEYIVTVKQRRKMRTVSQNRLYWLWLSCISLETGNDREDLHRYFSDRYMPKRSLCVFGQDVSVGTSELDTSQFTAFLERVRSDALGVGIVLPDPQDTFFEQFLTQYEHCVA